MSVTHCFSNVYIFLVIKLKIERSRPMHFSGSREHSMRSRKVRRLSFYNEWNTSRPISPRATLQATDPDIRPPSSPGLGVLGDINSTSSTIILWRSSFLLFSDKDICLCNLCLKKAVIKVRKNVEVHLEVRIYLKHLYFKGILKEKQTNFIFICIIIWKIKWTLENSK